jgi:hypothetical protein
VSCRRAPVEPKQDPPSGSRRDPNRPALVKTVADIQRVHHDTRTEFVEHRETNYVEHNEVDDDLYPDTAAVGKSGPQKDAMGPGPAKLDELDGTATGGSTSDTAATGTRTKRRWFKRRQKTDEWLVPGVFR